METIVLWAQEHALHAHWIIFFGILLAGFNIPISADFLILAGAILAATVVPENLWWIFGSVFFGALFSAYIAYWIGRAFGPYLLKWPYFSKFLSTERLLKIQKFYDKYGLLTLIVGRFIPFGVRNTIFMTTGMSKLSFVKFIFRDFLACLLWTATTFSCFYAVGQNFETIKQFIYSFQLIVFAAFGVTVIGVIWYKKRKKTTKDTSL